MAEKTRAELVAEVSRRLGFYLRGTATAGSTTTVVDTDNLLALDNFWVGHYVYLVEDAGGAGAAPEGEERVVTGYVRSTATLTIAPAFTAAAAAGDTYELLALRRADVVAALNGAIRASGETWLVYQVDDATVTIADDDYDYDLPVDVARLLAVWARDATDEPWMRVRGEAWQVAKTPGAQELVFGTLAGLGAGDLIRLEYMARVAEMATDAAVLGVGEPAEREMVDFVVAYALFLLHDQAASASGGGAGYRGHLTQAQYWREEAGRVKASAGRFGGRGTVHGKRWARSRG